MNQDRYPLISGKDLFSFEFFSVGPNGKILKLVQITATRLPNVYNLAFGNKNAKTGKIDDLSVSDNGDREKILATVVSSVYAFTDKYPNVWVYAEGSTNTRNRLYRMGISKYLDNALNDFYILGLSNDMWEIFTVGNNYEAFVAKRK